MFAVSCNFHLSLLKFIPTYSSLKNVFHLVLINDGRPVDKKKKQELAALLQSHYLIPVMTWLTVCNNCYQPYRLSSTSM